MKRTLALTVLAVAVPFVPGHAHAAVAQASPAPAVACPSDTPIVPPVGDVDQFVAFDSHGCPVPSAPVPAVAPSRQRKPAEAPVPAPAPAVAAGRQLLSETTVVIPVEDGLVATTGEAVVGPPAPAGTAGASAQAAAATTAAKIWVMRARLIGST